MGQPSEVRRPQTDDGFLEGFTGVHFGCGDTQTKGPVDKPRARLCWVLIPFQRDCDPTLNYMSDKGGRSHKSARVRRGGQDPPQLSMLTFPTHAKRRASISILLRSEPGGTLRWERSQLVRKQILWPGRSSGLEWNRVRAMNRFVPRRRVGRLPDAVRNRKRTRIPYCRRRRSLP